MKVACSTFCHFDIITKHSVRLPDQTYSSIMQMGSNLGLSSSILMNYVDASPTVGNMDPVVVAGVYEPIMPSTETIFGMTLIVVLCALTAWIWQNQVVPTARTNLAISKSRGPLKEYLDELKASDPRKRDDELVETDASGGTSVSPQPNRQLQGGRAMERWLFTDWLRDNKSDRRAGRQKEPALPILRNEKWNSGDNPILVATLLIGLGVVLTAFTERVASLAF